MIVRTETQINAPILNANKFLQQKPVRLSITPHISLICKLTVLPEPKLEQTSDLLMEYKEIEFHSFTNHRTPYGRPSAFHKPQSKLSIEKLKKNGAPDDNFCW